MVFLTFYADDLQIRITAVLHTLELTTVSTHRLLFFAAQNAATRLLTRRQEHNTPMLASLRWFPVHFRIDLKNVLFVIKSVHGLGPYISDLITKNRGDRAFSLVGP